jgi:polyisoprenyl-phosphate glycosyltransferase
MKKIIILIPVYNDWESLHKLLIEINHSIKFIKNIQFNCVIVNDSSKIPVPEIKKPSNITAIELINMKKNKGHARCNAFAIRHLSKIDNFDHLILMDGDGEDRPEEIALLVEQALSEENTSVVAKRVKRSEGLFFQFLYQAHKIITILFTGKNINFGNYSCLTKLDVKKLSTKKSLWSSFSGSLKFHIPELNSIKSKRGLRYFGPSKMSLFKLFVHSLSIIAVFKKKVFLRSAILIIFSSFFVSKMALPIIIFQFLITVFNILIYIVSLRENEKEFLESDLDIENIKTF